jgi:hypothetical protein
MVASGYSQGAVCAAAGTVIETSREHVLKRGQLGERGDVARRPICIFFTTFFDIRAYDGVGGEVA